MLANSLLDVVVGAGLVAGGVAAAGLAVAAVVVTFVSLGEGAAPSPRTVAAQASEPSRRMAA
jgi:hypothetical protein